MEKSRESMKYIQIEKHGGPDVLKLSSQAVPNPGPDEVLIKVKAAGVNRPDICKERDFILHLLMLLMCRD